MKRRIAVLAALVVVIILGVSVYRAIRKKLTFQPPESIEAIQKELGVPVLLAEPLRTNLTDYLQFKATVEPVERAVVMSRLTARVLRILVEEGDPVQGPPAPTRLVELESQDLVIRHQAATSSLHEAQANYTRSETLLAAGGLSRQEFDRAAVRLDAARAEAAKAASDLADVVIASPITGRVFRRLVEPGNVTGSGTKLLEIVDTSRLKVVFHIPEMEIPGVRTGLTCLIRFDAYPDQPPLEARVDVVIPGLNPDTRQLEAVCYLDRPDRPLLPGMHARVDVERERRLQVPAIPNDALVRVRGQDGVFVARERDGRLTAEFAPLTLGLRSDGLIEVRDGLAPGARLITRGQHQVSDGAPIRAQDAE
jgi:membrane fusion protein (multidrug efflux system)